jgi:NAD(P)-dependent dehydrogenase (short-subunit alcohol dehydrogenase family)
VKPDLSTMEINLLGVHYTTKLAFHYFRRQALDASRDRCLILKSSLAGYVDLPGSIQYTSAKFGVRGLMRSLRRTAWEENIRVNLVAPWYVKTPIIPSIVQDYLIKEGVGFATTDDAAKAMLLIASDKTINGKAVTAPLQINLYENQRLTLV